MSKFKVLLLTNRDSDNVGDQIIEASVISLIKGVMKNLGMKADDYAISTRAAGIISKKYLSTQDPALLEGARKAISSSDVIIFGGAPLFNYSYQNFYKRTIATVELAQEYGVPVLFSSIGVEAYNPDNAKSRALRTALELPVVRQITTRDDVESARRYVESTGIPVAHVADPAVFADIVFRKAAPAPARTPDPKPAPAPAQPTGVAALRERAARPVSRLASLIRGGSASRTEPAPAATPAPATATLGPKQPSPAAEPTEPAPRRIGLVVTRAGIAKDNGIDFSEDDQVRFWLDVIAKLEARGEDYKLFTTGHFSDEVFLDNLVREHGVPAAKVSFTVNSPEELVAQLSACDGIIAYRLHASITSFAYAIPSIGLSWNFKVPYFYDSVGYPQRAVAAEDWNADHVIAKIDEAMAEGVEKDIPFLMSVYETLFSGLRDIIDPESTREPFTYEQLATKLPRYGTTSQKQYQEKVRRKFRRTYENYKKQADALAAAKAAK